jgi:hypothetical protein
LAKQVKERIPSGFCASAPASRCAPQITRAAKAGINFSQALQEALFAKLGVAR